MRRASRPPQVDRGRSGTDPKRGKDTPGPQPPQYVNRSGILLPTPPEHLGHGRLLDPQLGGDRRL